MNHLQTREQLQSELIRVTDTPVGVQFVTSETRACTSQARIFNIPRGNLRGGIFYWKSGSSILTGVVPVAAPHKTL